MGFKTERLPQIPCLIHENPYILKKVENIFALHPLVLHGFILKVGKNIPFLYKKTTKGVDGPSKGV